MIAVAWWRHQYHSIYSKPKWCQLHFLLPKFRQHSLFLKGRLQYFTYNILPKSRDLAMMTSSLTFRVVLIESVPLNLLVSKFGDRSSWWHGLSLQINLNLVGLSYRPCCLKFLTIKGVITFLSHFLIWWCNLYDNCLISLKWFIFSKCTRCPFFVTIGLREVKMATICYTKSWEKLNSPLRSAIFFFFFFFFFLYKGFI